MGYKFNPERRQAIKVGGVLAAATIAGASAVVAAEKRLIPGRGHINKFFGLDGPDGVVPDVPAAPSTSGSFVSAACLGREIRWTIARPPAPGPLHPVILLHGAHSDHSSPFRDGGIAHYLTQAVNNGVAPFAVVGVDASDTFYHRRASGEDAGAMVLDELIPLLATIGLDTSRIGFLGWSMGGYGAFLLAPRLMERPLGADRVAAVVATSPGLFPNLAAALADERTSFDSADDFAANNVYDRIPALAKIPVRVDAGNDDPYVTETTKFVAALRKQTGSASNPAGGFEPGEHTWGYWRRMLPDQLAFLGAQLAR